MHNNFRLETEVQHRQFEHERRVKAIADEAQLARTGKATSRPVRNAVALAALAQLIRFIGLNAPMA